MKNKFGAILLSVAIAFGLWLYVITYVSPNSEETYYNIPVVLEGESVLNERGLMCTSTSSSTVSLQLAGARSDLIKVNQGELIGYVESIRFRHTIIRTYESNRIIVPNATLNSATIENAFFQDARKNNYLEIEVSYGTDIDLAIDILKSLVEKTMGEYDIESETPIEVKVINFSTTGIDLRVVVPSKTSLDGFDMLAKIRYELVKEYEKANIHFGNYSVEVSQS